MGVSCGRFGIFIMRTRRGLRSNLQPSYSFGSGAIFQHASVPALLCTGSMTEQVLSRRHEQERVAYLPVPVAVAENHSMACLLMLVNIHFLRSDVSSEGVAAPGLTILYEATDRSLRP